jgi:tRNA G37 N-methylase Trm5
LTIGDTIIYKEIIPSLTNKKTDWENYSIYLEENITLNVLLKTYDQIENEAKLFTEQLLLAAKVNTPILKKTALEINYSTPSLKKA